MAPTQSPYLADPCYQPPTSVTVVDGDAVIVGLRGEYDSSTITALTGVLNAGADRGSVRMVVDLAGVTFMDSATIRVLEHSAERLAGQSRRLTLRNPTVFGRRILGLCGAAGLIEDNPGPAAGLLALRGTRQPGRDVHPIG